MGITGGGRKLFVMTAIGNPESFLALDLRRVISLNDGRVAGSGSITITTGPARWSYAAGLRFSKQETPRAERIVIQADLVVHKGHVGIGFVRDDLIEYLAAEQERSEIDGDCTVELSVDNIPDFGWIIIRNTTAEGSSSECELTAIRDYSCDRSPLNGFAEWAVNDQSGKRVFSALAEKWKEVPVGLRNRRKTTDLLRLADTKLERLWTQAHDEETTGDGYSTRGWYQELYADVLRGKRVLDVGPGFGIDGITFARCGAHVTFLDIAPSNLELLGRLCKIFHLATVEFQQLESFESLGGLPDNFDFIWCQGSMINAPFEFARREARALIEHLRIGGRWVELAYPRERWVREGSLSLEKWAQFTDGLGTPWVEWYNLPRLLDRLRPAEFEIILSFNFHNDDFNWFDLARRR